MLAYRKTIGPVNAQQPGTLQTDTENCVDLWHTTMGMQQTMHHCYNAEIPKQSTPKHR